MDYKRIFVYDTTNEFSGFIRDQYWDNYVDVCNDPKSIDTFNYSGYDAFFIIVTDSKDVRILFKTINNIHSPLFLGTNLKEIKDSLKGMARVRNLDMIQIKSQLKEFIEIDTNTIS